MDLLRELVWPTTWWGWSLLAVCIILVLLPPKYDPAVRLKEWTERARNKRKGN